MNCPECGCGLKHTHPKRSKKGQIIYYRRWTCTSCDYYEATNIRLGWHQRQPLSLVEKDEFENKKAEKFFRIKERNKKYNPLEISGDDKDLSFVSEIAKNKYVPPLINRKPLK